MFRRVTQMGKRENERYAQNDSVEHTPCFVVRTKDSQVEIAIWPEAWYYPESGNFSLNDASIYVIVDNLHNDIDFWCSEGKMRVLHAEKQFKYHLKFIECLQNSDFYEVNDKADFLIENLKKDGFTEIYFTNNSQINKKE